jgi:hypothetical protein
VNLLRKNGVSEIQTRLLPLAQMVEKNEIITSDGYRSAIMGNPRFIFRKRDYLFKSGSFRDEQQASLITISRASLKNKILLSSHSDYKIGLGRNLVLRSLGLEQVFSTNLRPVRGFSTSLPLGLTNDSNESPIHAILGNHSHLVRASEDSNIADSYMGSLLINFTVGNSSKNRRPIIDLLPRLKREYKIIESAPDFSEVGRINYLKSLRTTNLVLCPEGNGIDTHRLWETLYMGGVPVIITNPYLNSITHDLPVIHLKSWDDLLDTTEISRRWEEISNHKWNLEKLNLSYWVKLFPR